MATQGQRKRGGGAKKSGAGSPTHLPVSLAAGLQGVSQLAGNRALLKMVARSKAQLDERSPEDETVGPELEEKEERLGEHRLALEKAKTLLEDAEHATFDDLKEMVLELLAAMHAALGLADGYKDELADLMKKVGRTEDTSDQAQEALLEMLQAVVARGEEIHSHLVDRLDRDDGALQLPAHLVKKLSDEAGELQEQAQGKHPPGEAAAGALGGAGLARKKKKKKSGR